MRNIKDITGPELHALLAGDVQRARMYTQSDLIDLVVASDILIRERPMFPLGTHLHAVGQIEYMSPWDFCCRIKTRDIESEIAHHERISEAGATVSFVDTRLDRLNAKVGPYKYQQLYETWHLNPIAIEWERDTEGFLNSTHRMVDRWALDIYKNTAQIPDAVVVYPDKAVVAYSKAFVMFVHDPTDKEDVVFGKLAEVRPGCYRQFSIRKGSRPK